MSDEDEDEDDDDDERQHSTLSTSESEEDSSDSAPARPRRVVESADAQTWLDVRIGEIWAAYRRLLLAHLVPDIADVVLEYGLGAPEAADGGDGTPSKLGNKRSLDPGYRLVDQDDVARKKRRLQPSDDLRVQLDDLLRDERWLKDPAWRGALEQVRFHLDDDKDEDGTLPQAVRVRAADGEPEQLIRPIAFRRFVLEIAGPSVQWEPQALEALQCAAEAHLQLWFTKAALIAGHCHRTCVTHVDTRLVQALEQCDAAVSVPSTR